MLETAPDYGIISTQHGSHPKDYNPFIKIIWKESYNEQHDQPSNFYWQLTLVPRSPQWNANGQRPFWKTAGFCFVLKPSAWAKSILIYFKYIHYCPLKTHYHFVLLRGSNRALFAAALGISNHCVPSLAIPCASVRDICLFSVTNVNSGRSLRSMQITGHKCERSQGPASPAARHNQPMVTDWFQFINSQWTSHLFQNWLGLSPATARPQKAPPVLRIRMDPALLGWTYCSLQHKEPRIWRAVRGRNGKNRAVCAEL